MSARSGSISATRTCADSSAPHGAQGAGHRVGQQVRAVQGGDGEQGSEHDRAQRRGRRATSTLGWVSCDPRRSAYSYIPGLFAMGVVVIVVVIAVAMKSMRRK